MSILTIFRLLGFIFGIALILGGMAAGFFFMQIKFASLVSAIGVVLILQFLFKIKRILFKPKTA